MFKWRNLFILFYIIVPKEHLDKGSLVLKEFIGKGDKKI